MNTNETSGIWQSETINNELSHAFMECEILPSEGYALLVKAKRKGRWWMLKGLKEEFRNEPLYRELQEKEYTLLSSLQHPGIVQCFDMEEVEPYGRCLVMEYVEGVTLDAFLATKPRRSTRKVLAEQLLEIVGYIHSKQIVHRDLKPQNILITHNGKHIKLLDLGLADSDAHYLLSNLQERSNIWHPNKRKCAWQM